jgi:hypothetical protein
MRGKDCSMVSVVTLLPFVERGLQRGPVTIHVRSVGDAISACALSHNEREDAACHAIQARPLRGVEPWERLQMTLAV